MSRVTERLIIHKYLLPALPSDQFAYKPTGSTAAALIAITHHISHLLESSSYFRCILIDYSKAFDTINHAVLLQKLKQLNIPSNIFLFIINFLSGRTQALSSFGQTSSWYSFLKASYKDPALAHISTRSTLRIYELCHLMSNTLTILRYLLAKVAQLISLRNMKISVLGLSETNSLLTPAKQKKLFFIGLPIGVLIFHLLCQTLNESLRLHYWELISPPLSPAPCM